MKSVPAMVSSTARAGWLFDSNNELLVVDSRNSRVQRFTVDGEFLHAFGTAGSDPGQFNLPWGVGVDRGDNIYVADWGNDRIQKFTAEGEFVGHIRGIGPRSWRDSSPCRRLCGR